MTTQNEFTWSKHKSFEENIKGMGEFHNKNTKPGMGFFFDFSKTPEIEKPIIDFLKNNYGWKLEYKKTFLRKPE